MLTHEEKRFLLAVERGDLATSRRILSLTPAGQLNINCTDPLGRSALLMAIDNENLEMIELLLHYKVDTKDALLHAISEEYVEAVEVLLEHEEAIKKAGEPHSWEAIERDTATFTPDITPLILAAHRDNYEILKILLDRGYTFPAPHRVRCGCADCVRSRYEDSLRHSRSRINSYRALSSPSLVALSSKDPILTAFELSGELRRLSFLEHEFKAEYMELRRKCQDFATALLDHTRTSYELEVMLNYDPSGPAFEHGDRMHLSRLKMAIKYKQKKFCAHPNVQQLLASIWYEGLPGFRRKNIVLQMMEILRIGLLFPIYSVAYILAPRSELGRTLRKPFIKFICHSASYITFLFLLILASQRIETVMIEWFGTEEMKKEMRDDITTKRGAPPSIVEWIILAWVSGLIWSEMKQLWDLGLMGYVSDMWNIIDFITNSLYVATVALRLIAYLQVQKEIAQNTGTAYLPRENWDAWDPILIAEGLFATANIFSSLRLVYIFSVNPHLGPLQISLGRMVIDIVKFFFVYTLVLFAFACGMNQLLWYYADNERQLCQTLSAGNASQPVGGRSEYAVCFTWRRFSNLFESSQTLFWASFGLIDLNNFELVGIQSYTRFWGLLMFGCYCVINVVVLLNLLIAMMNHSYQMISEHADVEWKFARCKLWMSYFEDGGTVPPPFNIIPTPKSIGYLCSWFWRKFCGHSRSAKKEHLKTIRRKARQASERDLKYQSIMRNLVRRYVTSEQRRADNQGVTEDDVNEIKQEISSFRYELLEVLKTSGFNTSMASGSVGGLGGGKKGRQRERRLMKGFNIGLIDSSVPSLPEINVEEMNVTSRKPPGSRLARLARLASKKSKLRRSRWGHLVEATRNARAAFSRSRSEDSVSSQNSYEPSRSHHRTHSHHQSQHHTHSHEHHQHQRQPNEPHRLDNLSSGSSDNDLHHVSSSRSETALSMRNRFSKKLRNFSRSKLKLAFSAEGHRKAIAEKKSASRTLSAPPTSLRQSQLSLAPSKRHGERGYNNTTNFNASTGGAAGTSEGNRRGEAAEAIGAGQADGASDLMRTGENNCCKDNNNEQQQQRGGVAECVLQLQRQDSVDMSAGHSHSHSCNALIIGLMASHNLPTPGLSPIPSCASSKVPSPRNSINDSTFEPDDDRSISLQIDRMPEVVIVEASSDENQLPLQSQSQAPSPALTMSTAMTTPLPQATSRRQYLASSQTTGGSVASVAAIAAAAGAVAIRMSGSAGSSPYPTPGSPVASVSSAESLDSLRHHQRSPTSPGATSDVCTSPRSSETGGNRVTPGSAGSGTPHQLAPPASPSGRSHDAGANGLPLLVRMYGIEPANKPMNVEWI
ncbi:transient receptor potential-gamma protein-like [Varroa jacobsoni]|uniref:transient receptor potential-gamma protein-like n=1 Tax=Varroa jacobsoni TaxID=62625 RepID=UPI000BF2B40B|nr:transient receptor potential-gamma protein-like [Varroa jacobsoni]